MVPFANELRGEVSGTIPLNWLAIYPVLALHAKYETGETWLSNRRLAILAGVGEAAVGKTLEELKQEGWLSVFNSGGRIIKKLESMYSQAGAINSRGWYAIGAPIIERGVWGAMPPQTKQIYSILLAYAWHPNHAFFGDPFICAELDSLDEEDEEIWSIEIAGRNISKKDFTFLAASIYDPRSFRERSDPFIDERQWRRGLAWLLDNGLISPAPDDCKEGYIIIRDPGLKYQPVLDRLKKLKERQQGFATAGGHRSYTAHKKRIFAQGIAPKKQGYVRTDGEHTSEQDIALAESGQISVNADRRQQASGQTRSLTRI